MDVVADGDVEEMVVRKEMTSLYCFIPFHSSFGSPSPSSPDCYYSACMFVFPHFVCSIVAHYYNRNTIIITILSAESFAVLANKYHVRN